ncbi:MAG: complex I subunit 5 family protein [Gammaproteobacteria bacterium]
MSPGFLLTAWLTPRWLPALAALPGLVVALSVPAGAVTDLGWLLLGVHLALDGTARLFLLYTSLAWFAAALYLLLRPDAATGKSSFLLCFLLAMAGNMLLILAADMLTFYAGFALMGLSAYGLVVAPGTLSAMRAGRRYLVWTIAGELALFSGIVLLATSSTSLLLADLDIVEPAAAAVLLILLGFGVKMALPGLHFWLPPVYRAAPAAAAAVMSGPMLSAGLLGWLRFLPPATPGLAEWSQTVIVLGIAGAVLGFSGGILQRDARGALAWSSIAKAGSMTAILGAGLAMPDAAPVVLAALVLFMLHHLVIKSALFLGMGEVERYGRPGWLVAGLVLLSLSLAGAPWTGGAAAKARLTEALGMAGFDAGLLFTAAAVATAMVMARFLWLVARQQDASARAGRVAPLWLAFAIPAAWMPFGLSQASFSPGALLALAAGILLFAATRSLPAGFPAPETRQRMPAIPMLLARWKPDWLSGSSDLVRSVARRMLNGEQRPEPAVMHAATAGVLWLGLFAILLSTLILFD